MKKSVLKNKRIIITMICVLVVGLAAVSIGIWKYTHRLTNYNAMSVEELLEGKEPLTWVFAGDSITHNATWSQGMNSYSEWFEQYLYDNDRADDTVYLTAWGGADIYDFQTIENTVAGKGFYHNSGKGLEGMITKYNPDVIFIKLGMNDRDETNEEFESYYNKMLDSIYADGKENGKIPKIVLLSTSPLSVESASDDEKQPKPSESNVESTLRQRDIVQSIAKHRELLFCDFRTAFFEEEKKLGEDYETTFFSEPSDGKIHPNAAGQYLIFTALSKTLGIYDENQDIYQLQYEDVNLPALYTGTTADMSWRYELEDRTRTWVETTEQNYVWAVAGAEQMSGYEGPSAHRSLFRLIDNVMRGGGNGETSMRDIRLANMAKPGNTVQDMLKNYDTTIGGQKHDVLLLLPEVPTVYDASYKHSSKLVKEYKSTVEALIEKETMVILWTPLASNDTKLNGYIGEYAEAIRQIAKKDTSILFFDANQFMNENMEANTSLAKNWFEEGAYISPLGAVDVTRAFYSTMLLLETGRGEVVGRNLRFTEDIRDIKSEYVRDYIAAKAGVSGKEVNVDIADIQAAYPNVKNIRLALLPYPDAGNFNEDIVNLEKETDVSVSGTIYSFTMPYENPIIAVYGEVDGCTYRFKDIRIQ